MSYRKFSEERRAKLEAVVTRVPEVRPEPAFATFAAFARVDGETRENASGIGLVYQQSHKVDSIIFSAPDCVSSPNQEPALTLAKGAKLAKVSAEGASGPPADWWRDQFEQRSAIRESELGYTRVKAERLAWGELEYRWHRLHGERLSPEVCAGCRQTIGRMPALDMVDGNRVHFAADHQCLIAYGKRWRGRATRALVKMGLTPPSAAAA